MIENLTEFANPYDFANPVSEERSFYGRSLEVADITYYLKQAKLTTKPIHLALVGPRASGKTSFLNIAEIEARRRDFCVVRINLNEGDVISDLQFFRKLFNSTMMAAFSSGLLGGRSSKSFLSYIELTATGKLENLDEMPYTSAILISAAIAANNANLNVPDDMLFDDLTAVQKSINKPIVILVDECNVLRENRIILEKLRNIFMNMTGFMLIFAATDDFFPVMNEVFSPIMRQFKRIDIGPFKGDEDVKQCVRSPLERASLSDRDIRQLATPTFINEVEALSARKPYEIQLICHELFKRCQEGKSKRFALNLNTLESIQEVLARGQNIDDRQILRAARRMKTNLFNVLEAACGGTEYLSVNDTWRVEYLFNGNERWDKIRYHQYCSELEELGFIKINSASCIFAGDQFDRIYLKYLARTKNAYLTLAANSVEEFIFRSLQKMAGKFEKLAPIGAIYTDPPIDIEPLIALFGQNTSDADFDILPVLEGVLLNIMYQDPGSTVRLYELRFKADIGVGQTWMIWQEPDHVAGLKKLRREFEELTMRGVEVGFEIEVKHWDLSVLSPHEIGIKVKAIGNEQFATRISNELLEMVQLFYVKRSDKSRAMASAKAAFELQNSRLHANANNVGYLYLDYGDFKEARLWLDAALQYADDDDMQLNLYNSGVLHALDGEIGSAISDLKRALTFKVSDPACIHKLMILDDCLGSVEVLQPASLKAEIDRAVEMLSARLH